jgi:predicted Zn-ribbon and HTH transcriptional regulator
MKKDNLESFKNKVQNQVGNEYEVLGDYINSRTKIKMKHNKCGYEWDTFPSVFNNGRRCPKCAGRLIITESLLKEKMEEKFGKEYLLLEYSGFSNKPSKFKHEICGTEFLMRSNNLINQGNKCPYCSGKGN